MHFDLTVAASRFAPCSWASLIVLFGATACEEGVRYAPAETAGASAPAPSELGMAPLSAAGAVPVVQDALAPAPAEDAAARNRVETNGVRGELVPVPFLSPQELGQSLILLDWEIPSGAEQYLCGRVTVPSDVYIRGFQPLSPVGTHHTALTIREAPNAPDGVSECDVSEVGPSSVFGSGVGTLGNTLPQGLGVKIAAGSQIIFNLHLMNATGGTLRGRSGTLVQTTTPETIRELADGVAVGPLKLNVPPGRSVQGGVCTVDHDYSIYAVMPHMHQTGVHMRVLVQRAGLDPLMIHDAAYDFDSQVAHRFEPFALHKGDTITVECTFDNPYPHSLHFGESSNDEMCLAAVARYPAGGKSTCPY